MFKFVTIYKRVDDEANLEEFFAANHLPLAEGLPGLIKSEISRVEGKPGGESRFHLMVESYFDSSDDFRRALASPGGVALMRQLKPWADARLVDWFYADSYEEARVGLEPALKLTVPDKEE